MFQIQFDRLQLSSGEPISGLCNESLTAMDIMAEVGLVVSGETLPQLATGEGPVPFNDWCGSMRQLPFKLMFEDGCRFKVSERWGRLKELTFVRKGDDITISVAGDRRKFHCKHQDLASGIERFKCELRERLLAGASRDEVALWWQRVFLEQLP